MYELKTLLPQFDIKLPTCMYELKNASLSPGAATGPSVSAKFHQLPWRILEMSATVTQKVTVQK